MFNLKKKKKRHDLIVKLLNFANISIILKSPVEISIFQYFLFKRKNNCNLQKSCCLFLKFGY